MTAAAPPDVRILRDAASVAMLGLERVLGAERPAETAELADAIRFYGDDIGNFELQVWMTWKALKRLRDLWDPVPRARPMD